MWLGLVEAPESKPVLPEPVVPQDQLPQAGLWGASSGSAGRVPGLQHRMLTLAWRHHFLLQDRLHVPRPHCP